MDPSSRDVPRTPAAAAALLARGPLKTPQFQTYSVLTCCCAGIARAWPHEERYSFRHKVCSPAAAPASPAHGPLKITQLQTCPTDKLCLTAAAPALPVRGTSRERHSSGHIHMLTCRCACIAGVGRPGKPTASENPQLQTCNYAHLPLRPRRPHGATPGRGTMRPGPPGGAPPRRGSMTRCGAGSMTRCGEGRRAATAGETLHSVRPPPPPAGAGTETRCWLRLAVSAPASTMCCIDEVSTRTLRIATPHTTHQASMQCFSFGNRHSGHHANHGVADHNAHFVQEQLSPSHCNTFTMSSSNDREAAFAHLHVDGWSHRAGLLPGLCRSRRRRQSAGGPVAAGRHGALQADRG